MLLHQLNTSVALTAPMLPIQYHLKHRSHVKAFLQQECDPWSGGYVHDPNCAHSLRLWGFQPVIALNVTFIYQAYSSKADHMKITYKWKNLWHKKNTKEFFKSSLWSAKIKRLDFSGDEGRYWPVASTETVIFLFIRNSVTRDRHCYVHCQYGLH